MPNPKGYLIITAILIAAIAMFFMRPEPKIAKRSSDVRVIDIVSNTQSQPSDNINTARIQLENIETLVLLYHETIGNVPESLETLTETRAPDLERKFCRKEDLIDPWDNPYSINKTPGEPEVLHFKIISNGPDGVAGNDDDLISEGIDPIALNLMRKRMEEENN